MRVACLRTAGADRLERRQIDRVVRVRAEDQTAGLDLRGRRIVLYAPTWKGGSFSRPADDARELFDTVQGLQARLGRDEYVVLLKTHQVVHRFSATNPALARVLVPNDIPTNTVLGLSDILITDYSSIFFDFLASDRPIVFYTPDASAYSDTRGTYLAAQELPGASCATLDELAAAVQNAGSSRAPQSERDATYRDWKERFVAQEDGRAAERVVDIVFRGNATSGTVLSISDDSRIPMLLHLGGMRSNGITSAALGLLSGIDHDRYDVSVVITRPRGAQQKANQARIDPRVRRIGDLEYEREGDDAEEHWREPAREGAPPVGVGRGIAQRNARVRRRAPAARRGLGIGVRKSE